MDSSNTAHWYGLFQIAGCLVSFYYYIPVLYASGVDPDQMPHSAASDLGLHCLPIILLGVSNLKWVKEICSS